jgi:hypothetical protein
MKQALLFRGEVFVRRLTEAGPACLLTMVQGNVAAITPEHWLVALKTGGLAGLGAVLVSFIPNEELRENKYLVAGIVGFCTAVADFIVHPTHFGGEHTEALVTGVAAGLLCIAFSGIGKKRSNKPAE